MDTKIKNRLQTVFSLADSELDTFIQTMGTNNNEYPNETYFKDILDKLPSPIFFKPSNTKRKANQNYEIHVNEGEQILSNNGTVIGEHPSGQFGTVKVNKNRPDYVYKFVVDLPELRNEVIKFFLSEPFINCILQEIQEAEPFVCKIYKVFCYKKDDNYKLVYKMETMGAPFSVLQDVVSNTKKNEESVQKNLKIFTKIFGPLYEVLLILREKYDFHHGDLHVGNMMFEKNPIKQDGTLDLSKLHVKMIDFGFSDITIDGVSYGYPMREDSKETQFIESLAWAMKLGKDFYDDFMKIQDDSKANINNRLEGKEHYNSLQKARSKERMGLQKLVIAKYKELNQKGGKRRNKTRKHRSKLMY